MNNRGIFIAVEGPIGVGKTTLANILNQHFGYTLLREIVEENPFLSKFYTDIKEYALQTEAFFLFNRFKQLEDTEKNVLSKSKGVVSDYHIIKNLIFAGITLDKMQFHRYKQVYNILLWYKRINELLLMQLWLIQDFSLLHINVLFEEQMPNLNLKSTDTMRF